MITLSLLEPCILCCMLTAALLGKIDELSLYLGKLSVNTDIHSVDTVLYVDHAVARTPYIHKNIVPREQFVGGMC